jgi:hypothetical protein
MMRTSSYHPSVERLEDRLPPGNLLLNSPVQCLAGLGLDNVVADPAGLVSIMGSQGTDAPQAAPAAASSMLPNPRPAASPDPLPPASAVGAPGGAALAATPAASPAPLGLAGAILGRSVNVDLLAAAFAPSSTDGGGSGGGEIQPQDNVVTVGALPGSFFQEGTNNPATFGSNPPAPPYLFSGVDITDSGTFDVPSSGIRLPTIVTQLGGGLYISYTPRLQSDVTGTYDRHTGTSTLGFSLDLYIDSNQPNFNHQNCIVPATSVNLSTENAPGHRYVNGVGTLVDDTFPLNAIPPHSCGSFFGLDYTNEINSAFGLPSPSGQNKLHNVTLMSPALRPFAPSLGTPQAVSEV